MMKLLAILDLPIKTAASVVVLIKIYNHAHWMTKAGASMLEVNKLTLS